MSNDIGDSDQSADSFLDQARGLLNAAAIRALADDVWSVWRPWLDIPVAILFIVVMTWLLAPAGGGVQPIPELGSIAPQTIRAERDVLVEDDEATRLRRQSARGSVLSAFDYDPELYFNSGKPVIAAVEAMAMRAREAELDISARRAAFQVDLGHAVNATTFDLIEGLEQPGDIAAAFIFFFNIALDRYVVSDRALMPEAGGIMIRDLESGEMRGLDDTRVVIDLAQVQRLMKARAGDAPYGSARIIRTWVMGAAMELIRPNLRPNGSLTDELRQTAVDAVEPVYVSISSGEVVIREGDRVGAAVQERLRHLNESAGKRSVWGEVLALAFLISSLVVAGALLFHNGDRVDDGGRAGLPDRRVSYQSLSIVVLTTLFCVASFYGGRGLAEGLNLDPEVAAYLPPVALATVLIALLVDNKTGLFAGVALALLLAYRVDGDLWHVLYYTIGVFVAGITARRCHRRTDLLKVGMAVGGAQIVAVPLIFALSTSAGIDGLGAQHLTVAGFALASGALLALAASALLPTLEHLFDEITEMRIIEMASADNPLLKELAVKCPGTYYHSLVIANLAEAGGSAVGANGRQCRLMALYHDIGKTVRPSYFAENQRGENIHDRLPAELSARIIFAHIKDGIDLARKHRLGRPILDAVTQHQGTTLLRVFYNKALEEAKETGAKVRERDYRYPGPRPQTREAGILLLADGVEAATRALKDPSPAEISERIENVVTEKVAEGQLDECSLTLLDLSKIKSEFCRVLTLGVYHTRIEYPPRPELLGVTTEEHAEHRNIHSLPSLADRNS